ncbi:protein SIEVE ELEMENT OCCLUSION A-like [Zingiber officinale]|uniref:protein SIEVE ELEMENT OCCLUSION A-like n=1 Tax=Zingiber officinale TaxID=94328 RepID=UPI001C4D3A50|nr:protein SIEVE ELEMENT OCCLUSION A-like [Zingiber officinale]
MKRTFHDLVADMPWYTLNPLCLKQEAKQYIKEKWMYEKKASLVVLHQGKVVCHDAFHLVRIWKKLDFSFTAEEANNLWSNVSWKLNLFEDHFDATTKEWVKKNNGICLYGGKDIEWIKKFTTELKRVSELSKTQLKIVYIGKHVKEVMNKARVEKYNVDCWDEAKICKFWEHLESMWHCKMQYQGNTSNNDVLLQELMRMISFGNSEEGWAIFSKGASSNIMKAHGKELLECFQAWGTSNEEFFMELSKKFSNIILPADHHCISFVLPRDAANFEEEVLCVQCQKPMDRRSLCSIAIANNRAKSTLKTLFITSPL